MAMDLREYIIGFLLVGLFMVGMFRFIVGLSGVNKPIQLDTDGINLTTLESKLSNSKTPANTYAESFTTDNPKESEDDFQLFTVVSTARGAMGLIRDLFVLITHAIYNTLGIPPLVTVVISTILLFGIIFAAWKVIKTGQ